ncbi:MAG: protein kinase [Pyrinomonadaceae bacterium]|nr:protein kinase [Pyrinomonadaceae bacterium]
MEINNWQQIEDVFHSAAALHGVERADYLAQSCGQNQTLRAEVESLLASLEERRDFLEEPAFDMGMKVLENSLDISLTGQEIGGYKILEKLGSGGMGEVYLADDVRLNRQVALKFLSNSLVDDAWAKRQLFREAQAVSMIDHPNICPVYDVKEIGVHSFIVMQYIEGKTLSDLIRNHQIEEKQYISIARQVTAALAAAHENGIIHRDIKAGNIMVTPNGQVKVLDFGLAKIIKNQKAGNLGSSPSLMTQTNAIVGTIASMSPEQLRAEKLDYRSDIFSLGIVFYELVTGRNPFLQTSDAETISAILTEQIKPITVLKNGNSAIFNRVIKKCLEKDKAKRYQSVSDLVLEFQNLQDKKPAKIGTMLFFRSLAAAVLLIIFLTVGAFVYQRAKAPRSLAVLPFINLSADSKNDFMSGMAETLIQKLSNSSHINVRPFTQVANYKTTDINPVEIGQNLKVDAVLTGKIIEQNNQLILETKLINIADGSQLWSDNSVLNESDTLVIQNNISEKIVSKLQSSLNGNDSKIRNSQYTANPEAYKYYLQGLDYWKKRDQNNIKKAIEAFNLATTTDPNYALAYSGLAYSYIVRPSVNYKAMQPKEAITLAKLYSEKAIGLDENLCEPHAALGAILHKYEWNWAAAEKQYRRAIELNPNVAQTYYWYSDLLAASGRFDEAVPMSLKAKELDPFTPLMDLNVGRVLYYARRFDEAEKYLTAVLKKDPDNTGAQAILAFVYLQQPSAEKHGAALKFLEDLYASDKKAYAASLGYAYGKAGKKAEAMAILNELERTENSDDYLPAHEKVLIYLGLDEKENAFFWLEKAYQERFMGLAALNVDPIYDGLRPDSRLQNLLIRMNFNNRF